MLSRAKAALVAAGCPWMADEISGGCHRGDGSSVTRPARALSEREAFAMLRCWAAAYEGLPICAADILSPDAPCPRCEAEGNEPIECVPNFSSERVAHHFVPVLMRRSR